MNDLAERYKTCGRCIHDGDSPDIVGSFCYLCSRNPTDRRIDWFEAKKEDNIMDSDNRTVITIKTKNPIEQERIGEHICKQLAGNHDFINDNILVNYTDDTDSVYILVSNEAKETTLNLTL